uniref:cell envelope integrity EipB family protein n=1 Tax=Stappia sp. TaxID=1870903 RepID=UPI003BAC3BCD
MKGLCEARGKGLAALTLAMATFAAPAAGAMELLPHRAVYDLSLATRDQASGIAGLRGRMVYEITGGACEGYSISFRFVTQVSDDSGGQRVTDLQTSSYEDADGKTFQFLSKTFVNRKLTEETRGRAIHEDGRIAIELTKPEERDADVAGKALFPTDHLRKLVAAAERGDQLFIADVFDGSEEGDKVYETTSVIGKPREVADDGRPEADTDTPEAVAAIGELPFWPVTISYFEEESDKSGEGLPIYQLSFLLYPNGVNRRLVLDYGSFALNGRLTDLQVLDPVPCEQ